MKSICFYIFFEKLMMYRIFNQRVLLLPSVLFTLTLVYIYFYILVDKSKIINKHDSRRVQSSLKHQMTRNLPDCIIIGAQKAGTRALITFINLHPEVVTAKKEVNFHSKNFTRGLDWYRSAMPLSHNGQLTIEKSPSYFTSLEAPHSIYAMNKNIKLVLAVREPVERLLSYYAFKAYQASFVRPNETFLGFEESVFKNNYSQIRDEYIGVNKSSYAIHMQRWLDVFPLEQFLIIECEKFVSNPTKEMQRFEEFLSLPPFFTDVNFYNRTNDAPSFVCGRRNLTDHGVCMGKSKGLKHPNVSLDVVSRLRKYFSRMNKVFYEQVKINFNWPED